MIKKCSYFHSYFFPLYGSFITVRIKAYRTTYWAAEQEHTVEEEISDLQKGLPFLKRGYHFWNHIMKY